MTDKFEHADKLAAEYAFEQPQTKEEQLRDLAHDIMRNNGFLLKSNEWKEPTPT